MAGDGMKLVSMTAYGFGEAVREGTQYTCEIRTLNSRFLEVNVRLPRGLIALEVDLINHVKAALKRGKVDLFVEMSRVGAVKELPQLDLDAVQHYAAVAKTLASELATHGVEPAARLGSLFEVMRLEGILTADARKLRTEDAAESHRGPVFEAATAALDRVRAARSKEGQALGAALLELTQQLRAGTREVAARRVAINEGMQKNYQRRLAQVLGLVQKAAQGEQGDAAPSEPLKIDDGRLYGEIAVLLDKADIEEELTRLDTHVNEFERLLKEDDAAGRKLDFLCQEMHREVNTISNKLVQTDVSQHTIEMKQTVERIRQQVQNLE